MLILKTKKAKKNAFEAGMAKKAFLYQGYISLPGMKGHKLQENSDKQFQSNRLPTENILPPLPLPKK